MHTRDSAVKDKEDDTYTWGFIQRQFKLLESLQEGGLRGVDKDIHVARGALGHCVHIVELTTRDLVQTQSSPLQT